MAEDQSPSLLSVQSQPYRIVKSIAVLGAAGIGKSAVTIRVAENRFETEYKPTLEDIFVVEMDVDGLSYEVRIIDTDGQEEDSPFGMQYTIGVDGYVLMFSVRDLDSLRIIKKVNEKLLETLSVSESVGRRDVPRILVGNKVDLVSQRQVPEAVARRFAEEIEVPYVECSAAIPLNTHEIFHTVLRLIHANIECSPDSLLDEESEHEEAVPTPQDASQSEQRKDSARKFPCSVQ